MPAATYELYGLAVQTRLPLPCRPATAIARPLVRIARGGAAWFDEIDRRKVDATPPAWCRYGRTDAGDFYLFWSGLFSFLISADGHDVRYRRVGDVPTESLVTYLLGQVLSFPLLRFGFEPIHATAVVVDGEAIALVGDCGYGKSTLAAALAARGLPILTDDLLVLEWRDRGWIAYPGIPRLKLFPSVARRLLGSHVRGVPMNGRTSKLVVPLANGQCVTRPVPLRAVYVLPGPEDRPQRAAWTGVEPMAGADAFLEVIRAAFNLQVTEKPRLASQFAFAERVAATVPIRRLHYRRSLAALPAVCTAILSDAAALPSASGTAAAKRRAPRGSSATM